MNQSTRGLTTDTPTAPSPRRGLLRGGRFAWLTRPRRILLAVACVWVLAIFDLRFTLTQWGTPTFREMNPLAERLLHGPPVVLALFKFGLLGLGSLLLLALRRHKVAELASWLLYVVMTYVAIRWYVYFRCVLEARDSRLIEAIGW